LQGGEALLTIYHRADLEATDRVRHLLETTATKEVGLWLDARLGQ